MQAPNRRLHLGVPMQDERRRKSARGCRRRFVGAVKSPMADGFRHQPNMSWGLVGVNAMMRADSTGVRP
jgi:hypothetical protein